MYYEKNPKTFIGVENHIQGLEDGDDKVVIFIGEAMKTIPDGLLDQGCL
jgi:hypothetical protein